MMKVKICGVKTEEIIQTALDYGADYIGFNFYPKSKRYLTLNEAERLRKFVKPSAQLVAVVVDGTDDFLAEIVKRVKPDMIQAHGAETPARIEQIKNRFGLPVIKALGVESVKDIESSHLYGAADSILFDNKKGGSGVSFDWNLLEGVSLPKNWILAGGVNEANLDEVMALSHLMCIDVSSGVEDRAGKKTQGLVRAFLTKAKAKQ